MSTSRAPRMRRWEGYGLALSFAWSAAFGMTQAAEAVTTEFEIEGYLNAPIIAERVHSTGNTHFVFQQYIDRGDLILAYDDGDTANIADDVVTITGTTDGGVCHKSRDCRNEHGFSRHRRTGDGVYFGSGTFAWDLMLSNPLDSTTDPGNFSFDMQQAGSITLNNAPHGVPAVVDVTAKAHPDLGYAFRLSPDGDIFRISTWLLNENGVVFGHGRAESLRNEAVFNSHLIAYCRSGNCRTTNEIPEPMTLGLLSAGLLGGACVRRRKQK